MAGAEGQAPSRKSGSTFIAIAGLFTTLAAAVVTSIVTNQAAQDTAAAQRSAQIEDQRRAVYVDFLASMAALCNTLAAQNVESDRVNSAFIVVLTQQARVELIASDDVRRASQELLDYVQDEPFQPLQPNDPNSPFKGCDDKPMSEKAAVFLGLAKAELQGY